MHTAYNIQQEVIKQKKKRLEIVELVLDFYEILQTESSFEHSKTHNIYAILCFQNCIFPLQVIVDRGRTFVYSLFFYLYLVFIEIIKNNVCAQYNDSEIIR